MEKTRVTKKDCFNAIIDILMDVENSAELVAFCEKEIAQLEKKAESAKAAAAKKKAAADVLTEAVAAALTDEFATIAEITERVEGDEVTSSKVQYRLNKLAECGRAVKGEVTVSGGEGTKSRKLVAFKGADEIVDAD